MIRQLAHEIKNPLGGLRGAAQLLERELHEAGLKEYTARHHRRGRSPDGARRLDGRAQPPAAEDAAQHPRALRARLPPAARRGAPAQSCIERDYDPSLPSAMLDRNQIIQALLNVARNALQAVGDRGRITLRTRALSNVSIGSARHRLVASVQVEDDGPGVPHELRVEHFLSARHRPRQRHRAGTCGGPGSRDPPRRPHRIRERAAAAPSSLCCCHSGESS